MSVRPTRQAQTEVNMLTSVLNSAWVKLCIASISNILQMVGRAGRPGYDDTGVAVIMTSKENQQRYENLSTGQEVVESQLPKRFMEGEWP